MSIESLEVVAPAEQFPHRDWLISEVRTSALILRCTYHGHPLPIADKTSIDRLRGGEKAEMLAQRAAQRSLLRLAERQHVFKFAAPAAIATGNVFRMQRRLAAATTISQETQHQNILAQQRLNRPVSPHLSIYKPQITWYGSISHRITGLILSGSFYLFGTAYLIAPYAGWHLESASIAAAFAAWPFALQAAVKLFFALPFTYHSFNGIRHLIWDNATMMTNPKVNASGWTVVGLSVVSALALALI